jgi:hypothetical protein
MLVQSDGMMSGILEICRRGISLAPGGLVIERVEIAPKKLLLVARPISKTAACPSCGNSARIHSQHQRALADLPSQGRPVCIGLRARLFRCKVAACDQKIFTEQLDRPLLFSDPTTVCGARCSSTATMIAVASGTQLMA